MIKTSDTPVHSTSFSLATKVRDYFALIKFTLSFTVVFSCVICYLLAPKVVAYDWDNEWDNGDGNWSSNTEYIMTPSDRERIDKRSDDNNSDDAIENYKRSKEELKKELERKQKETEELKKELEKAPDTVIYSLPSSVSGLLSKRQLNHFSFH